ncbi:DUF421 domain-containing protein [Frateuria soli]|uniref:DUF421 domain-containing protein n=1 Tax=Frateuria soli TaxID=1542730 RepID=UPI001E4C6D40|nr:YetF domain-containing protein [Frateuria soli]UGB36842.1 DUF421 domain-containing protein [Frateuria soli]
MDDPPSLPAMDKHFDPFTWARLFLGKQPYGYYLEVSLRIVLVFLLLMVVLRLLGKRGQQNLNPMQQVLLIALGSAAGDTLLYPNVAILYAALILVGTTALTLLLDWSARRWRSLRDYLDSRPRILVLDGLIDEEALARERVNHRELHAALRGAGARSIAQVQIAILEVSGNVSVFLNQHAPPRDDLLDYLRQAHGRGEPHMRDATPATRLAGTKRAPEGNTG